MKKKWITSFVFLLLVLYSQISFSQIIGIGADKKILTEYTDGSPNDTIYVWNGTELGKQNAKLKIVPKSGTAPYTFDWFYHDESTFSWKRFVVEKGNFSEIENLPTDGYRVQVKDANNKLVECHTTWVWNLNVETKAKNSVVNCSDVKLEAQVDAESNFIYYNLPPPESIITANTKIKVEFNARHTYVSDLAFYLVGPKSCGSPRILLSPNPGALKADMHICNSGDNVKSLSFSNTSTTELNVCASPAPLTGEYGGYALLDQASQIDWSSLIGCNAAQGDWSVQIYDCIYLDVGYLESASITFSDLESVCGSPTTISYDSGQMKSAIRDMSCSAETASIFQVLPVPSLRTPIVINANIEVGWYQNNINISNDLDFTVVNISNGNYVFDFKTEVSLYQSVLSQSVITKKIEINSSPPIAYNQSFCKDSNAKISDLIATGINLKWYLNESDTSPLSLSTNVRPGIYYVSQVVNGCESSRTKIEVTLLEVDAPLANDLLFCFKQVKVSDLTAIGSNLKWYLTVSGGEPLTSDTSVNEGFYYVSQTINGCESSNRTLVKVSIFSTPKPNVKLTNFCFNEQKKLKDLQINGVNIKFYLNEVDSISLSEETILSTGNYYVSQTLNGCESERELIQVNVIPSLSFIQPTDLITCSSSTFKIKLPGSADVVTYQWEVISDKVSGATNGSGISIEQVLFATTEESGTVIYKVTPIVNGCVGDVVELKVQVTPLPKVQVEIEKKLLCSGELTNIELISNDNNVTYRWSAESTSVIGATSGNGNIISQRLTTLENNAKVVYTIIPYINNCEGEAIIIEVQVLPLPVLSLKDGFLCYDVMNKKIITPYIIDSGLLSSNYSFEWFFEGNLIANENSPFYSATKKGKYTLKVTNHIGCSVSQSIYVSENKSVESATYVLTNYFRDAQTITVNVHGTGDYLYQLNDEPPQKSNVFSHVLPGVHKVIVTDSNNCTYILLEEIITVHYPNFFTPNEDGINDLWNIWSLKDKGKADIFIFDRFGKLIKQLSPQDVGWDGKIDGVFVPSTDYWFVVNYFENGISRTFKSHFSLKR